MDSAMRWLRASYWVPALVDFGFAGVVLSPDRMGVPEYVYPMGLMASVAFSWGVLLVVADREPRERRWVLPPTMLVVALLGGAALHAGAVGLIPAARAIATAVVAVVVLATMVIGYRRSRGVD